MLYKKSMSKHVTNWEFTLNNPKMYKYKHLQLIDAVDDYICVFLLRPWYMPVPTGRHVRATTRGHYINSATP